MKKYNLGACGGTFDHLHKGHKEFLRFALKTANKVIIGITSDSYIKNIKDARESYQIRKNAVKNFLAQENLLEKTELVFIDDIFGPTINNKFPIDVLIVSSITQNGAKLINKERANKNLKILNVAVHGLVLAEDLRPISSTRIKNGEIDRQGGLFIKPQWLVQPKILPPSLREDLKKPLGRLYKKDEKIAFAGINPEKTVTVGDIVTKMGNDNHFLQKISVVDFMVERKRRFTDILQLGFLGDEEIKNVDNKAGSISPSLFRVALDVFGKNLDSNKRIIIKINGEEDLAVLPFVLASPLDWNVFYGQPKEGIVKITVSEEIKKQARTIVSKFL